MVLPVYRVLSIDPTPWGFAFAVLEGSEVLIDWGGFGVPAGTEVIFDRRLEHLLDRYTPDVVVVEQEPDCRRSKRARQIIEQAGEKACARNVRVEAVTREAVRHEFRASGMKKHAIACAIARQFPELVPHKPRIRRLWMAEDRRMHVFDAVSFALTALSRLERSTRLH